MGEWRARYRAERRSLALAALLGGGGVGACLPSESTTPLGYVIASSSAPTDAGPLDAGKTGRPTPEPPP